MKKITSIRVIKPKSELSYPELGQNSTYKTYI